MLPQEKCAEKLEKVPLPEGDLERFFLLGT